MKPCALIIAAACVTYRTLFGMQGVIVCTQPNGDVTVNNESIPEPPLFQPTPLYPAPTFEPVAPGLRDTLELDDPSE